MRKNRWRALLGVLVLALVGAGGAACAPEQQSGRPGCAEFETPVFGGTNPVNQSTFLTTSSDEAAALTREGYTFTPRLGPWLVAASAPGEGLVEVHRLYRAKNHDYSWSSEPREIARYEQKGYVDQGPAFYLADHSSDCLVPVHRYAFRGQHRLVLEGEAGPLEQFGWKDEGTKFYAAPSDFTQTGEPVGDPTETPFTIAVVPDTQLEVVRANDTRSQDRSVRLVENQRQLNLAFVVHTGDIVDSPKKEQLKRADAGLAPLRAAGIPYALAVGNQDSAVRCSEATHTCSRATAGRGLRETTSFNNYFGSDIAGLQGQYEKGKLDNSYVVHEAGGVQWLVLSIEPWPRQAAVAWADEVVARHPHANVIVATHVYLDHTGAIISTDGGFGADATSPTYLFDRLIKRHENIKIVLSGHTGAAAQRTDKGVQGNTIYSFLGAFHDPKHAPTRLLEVDPARKTLTTWVYLSDTGRETPHTRTTFSGLSLVR